MEIGIFVVGLLAGVMSGLFGIGGGIVMVPALIAFFGMEMLNANATSLAAMLLPVGVLGVITYYKAGLINLKESLWIALGLFAGSFGGAELATRVDVSLLSKLYALFLLYVAVGYLNIPALISKLRKNEVKPADVSGEHVTRAFWLYIAVGLFAGVIAGMFGKGGGIVIVPMLIKFFRYDAKAATATSLAALQLPVGLPSVLVYAHEGYFNFMYAGLMALGIVGGVVLGSKLALNLPTAVFRKVYAVFLLGVATYMVYKYI
ncbi:sulfite exporter TauE/SafE family protein [Parabacteroides sp. FAFU027]|uniref:sulfite exporter TauE/SafE family protein n=1 Tax=Parabacteroides sp. FAFU027 TaxID=2922715 RepID=UPI001FAE8313|nr:sulfite exporter TauE/SafE family protein [Parabacteroides sp. FAFU027]